MTGNNTPYALVADDDLIIRMDCPTSAPLRQNLFN